MEQQCLALAALIHFLLLSSARSMERSGRLRDSDLAHIEDMLNGSDGDMRSIDIPPPPHTQLPHRAVRIMCSLGDKHYCPGEVLFRREYRQQTLRD